MNLIDKVNYVRKTCLVRVVTCLISFVLPLIVMGQQTNVSGVITDVDGEPLIGASVVIKGTTTSAVSDFDGKYALEVKDGATAVLIFSFVGYTKQEVAVNRRNIINIVLKDNSTLEEVVVTALGIKRSDKSISYNVQQFSGNDVNKIQDANFVNNLNGKVAGVTINSSSSGAGGASRVVMRGVKSISGNNNALYVIDGVPMPNLSSESPDDIFEGAGQTGDAISNLNSDDIESISVLTGPSAAALYGSSASNGVILVTTKKGKEGKLSINISNNTTFSNPLLLPRFQNTYSPSEQGSYYSWGEKLATPSSYKPADFFRTGVYQSNSISLSTGTKQNQTYASAGLVKSEGIVRNNDYERYNFSLRNTSTFFNNKVTMDAGFMASFVNEHNMVAQGQYFNPLIPAYLFPAGDDFEKVKIFKRYDASRNIQTQFWPYEAGFSMQNPYWITDNNNFINNKNRYMANISLKYDIADWINLTGRVKLDKDNEQLEKKFDAGTNTLFASETGYYSLNEISNRQIYGDVLLNISKDLNNGMFNVIATLGSSFEDVVYGQNMYGGKLQGVANLFTYSNVNVATSQASQTGYHKNKQAIFGSAQLGYKNMIYADVTLRNDWVSTLARSDSKSFLYPTVGLSGIITDLLDFHTDALSYAKLRVSYSEVGNEPREFLTIPTYPVTGGMPVTQTRMPNTKLEPERTKSWELGTNLVFLKNKMKLNVTLYKSSTYNQFFEPALSASSGFTSVIVNAGRVDNKGIEIMASFTQPVVSNLVWKTFFTYSLNQNKIVELLPGWVNPVTGETISLREMDLGGGTDSYKMTLKEGGSMGDIYVTTLKTDEHGFIYVVPGDNTIAPSSNDDPNHYIYAGNSNPKYNLGWGNTLSWKGLSLDFMFTARVGGIVVSNTQAIMDAYGISKASADARDAGGVLVNGYPINAQDYYSVVGGGTSGVGANYVYSATNVRLGELKLSYDIPVDKWVNWAKNVNVSFVGRNLFFLYNKAPFDPEITANTGTYYQGIDYFMMPSNRSLGFAVKIQF
ncbi:SusC/RagA family TonB-linked outer membrane protein [Dysgonomonas reticulitermitis]